MNTSLLSHLTHEQQLLGAAAGLTMIGVFLPGAIRAVGPGCSSALGRILKLGPKFNDEIWIGGVCIRDEARLRHTHIVGATGTGKSVLIEQLLYSDLARGLGALVIDPKGDREMYDRLKAFCKSIGREDDLHLLSASRPEESVRWNPCRLGDVSELQSKFFNSSVYDHVFYAKAVELGLLRAFKSLVSEHPGGFELNDLCEALEEISSESKDETLKGLFLDLMSLSLSEWGHVFSGDAAKKEISLLDITRKNEILFVDLPTESKKTQSQRIGRLILQELTLLSGMRKNFPHMKGAKPFSVYVDEFDAFATPEFATFLNKGRSSAFMIHLAHQTLSDLNQVSETFAGQIMGNTNVRFVFRQDDPDDAETWSRFFGTHSVLKRTFQTQDGSKTGMSSNREALEFRIPPDLIKDLRIGHCVVSIKTDRIFQELSVPHPNTNSKLWPKLPTIRGPFILGSETYPIPKESEQALQEVAGNT